MAIYIIFRDSHYPPALIPAAFTTCSYRTKSRLISSANFAGDPGMAVMPNTSSFARVSGSVSTAFNSAFNLSMTGLGVLAGANSPTQQVHAGS